LTHNINQELQQSSNTLFFKSGSSQGQVTNTSISFSHTQELFEETEQIPLNIFSQNISGLQAIVKFLHEHKHYSFNTIAKLLSRNPRTIWTSYQAVKDEKLETSSSSKTIPLHLFSNRHFSVLEHLVHYLGNQGLRFNKIAAMLNKDQRTIWTVNARYNKKEQ